MHRSHRPRGGFPYFFVGTFIEAVLSPGVVEVVGYFPSFSEGLSLRRGTGQSVTTCSQNFPSFSEGLSLRQDLADARTQRNGYFPSFLEGLSLRHAKTTIKTDTTHISLQFCRDYHWELVNALRESRTKSIPHRLEGVFIEVARVACVLSFLTTFPYILYGLSMRPVRLRR